MRMVGAICALTIILSVIAHGYKAVVQDNSGKIVGTWNSLNEINGAPQVVLEIKRTGKQYGGKFVFRGLTVNGKEDVTVELQITNASFEGNTFSFRAMFPEPEKKVTDWRLNLHSDDEADFEITREEDKPVENSISFVMKRSRTR